MATQNDIEEIFFKFLLQYKFDEKDLDYSVLDKHIVALQFLSDIGNSGISVFDISKQQNVFYSSNFGHLLGYTVSDYEKTGQQFFADKIHPEDKIKLSLQGISTLKIFNSLSSSDKLSYKEVKEIRMLNAQNKYVRLIEQYQVMELDKKGQVWLLMGVVDVSPNQEEYSGIKVQLLNFRTGKTIPLDIPPKAMVR